MRKIIMTFLVLSIVVICTALILNPSFHIHYTKKENTNDSIFGSNVEVGKIYLLEFKNNNNPFDRPWRDTILILGKKGGYVKWISKKWSLDTTKYSSSEEKIISRHITELN